MYKRMQYGLATRFFQFQGRTRVLKARRETQMYKVQ